MWPRSVLPAGEFGFVTARLETVIRRYGFAVEPVLWQIVILEAGVFVGAGVAAADGQAAAPAMTYHYKGKQYIVVAVGVGPQSELVAFSVT
jgi:hypothetical protein